MLRSVVSHLGRSRPETVPSGTPIQPTCKEHERTNRILIQKYLPNLAHISPNMPQDPFKTAMK